MLLRTLAISLGVIGAFSAIGCGPPPKPAIEIGPAISGLNLSGKWYCQEFGDMKLVHTKQTLTGSYADPRGPEHNGTLRGTITGDLVKLEWIKRGNPLAAIMPVRGRAWLRIARDGKHLDGRWGYDKNDDDGGPWHAEKSQFQ